MACLQPTQDGGSQEADAEHGAAQEPLEALGGRQAVVPGPGDGVHRLLQQDLIDQPSRAARRKGFHRACRSRMCARSTGRNHRLNARPSGDSTVKHDA